MSVEKKNLVSQRSLDRVRTTQVTLIDPQIQDKTSMLIITAYKRSNSCLTTVASILCIMLLRRPVCTLFYIQDDSPANRARHPSAVVFKYILIFYVIFRYKCYTRLDTV